MKIKEEALTHVFIQSMRMYLGTHDESFYIKDNTLMVENPEVLLMFIKNIFQEFGIKVLDKPTN